MLRKLRMLQKIENRRQNQRAAPEALLMPDPSAILRASFATAVSAKLWRSFAEAFTPPTLRRQARENKHKNRLAKLLKLPKLPCASRLALRWNPRNGKGTQS